MAHRTRRPEPPRTRGALPQLDPFSPEPPHPDWVRRELPEHAADAHTHGPSSSVRQVHHQGHELTITTTYEVALDGRPVPVHMLVDSDGRLWSHLCPYRTFGTATELVQFLLEHAPDALVGIMDHAPSEHTSPGGVRRRTRREASRRQGR